MSVSKGTATKAAFHTVMYRTHTKSLPCSLEQDQEERAVRALR